MKKHGLHVWDGDIMTKGEAMICTREALEKGSKLEGMVEARVLTEDEATEELELWMLREKAAGRNPVILITNIGQEP